MSILQGIALRNHVQIALNLPTLFWKQLTRSSLALQDLREIDSRLVSDTILLYQLLDAGSKNMAFETFGQLSIHAYFECTLSDGSVVELLEGGKQVKVCFVRHCNAHKQKP